MGFKTKTEKSIDETWQQWISFTLNAWKTLHYDMNAFENMPEEDMFGEFINRIILRYAPQAHCSFSNHLHEYRKIADEYNANLNEENKKQLIECLIKANRKTTDTTDKAHKKIRIYLQKDSF